MKLLLLINTMAENDYFRDSFRYYKQKNTAAVLNSVIDIYSVPMDEHVSSFSNFIDKPNDSSNCSICKDLNLKPHHSWNVRTFKGFDGFLFLQNPFTEKGQMSWIKKCLESYPLKHSVTNLHLCKPDLSCEGVSKYFDKLTWATLGYHYDWKYKTYNSTNSSPFPACLSLLSKHIAGCLGFEHYMPDAAIVNYYNKKSTLGIHNDHSEEALDQPIVSLSFGQTAVFLIGTTNRTDKPVSMFVRSGDVVIMSGKSRLSYHAVPAIILSPTLSTGNLPCTDDLGSEMSTYIQTHRINISVRQVYQYHLLKNSSN